MKNVDPKTLKAAYSSIFKGEMGHIVMRDLKSWCHIADTSFTPGDPYVSAFNEGKRFVYLRICKMAKIDLDKLIAISDNRRSGEPDN